LLARPGAEDLRPAAPARAQPRGLRLAAVGRALLRLRRHRHGQGRARRPARHRHRPQRRRRRSRGRIPHQPADRRPLRPRRVLTPADPLPPPAGEGARRADGGQPPPRRPHPGPPPHSGGGSTTSKARPDMSHPSVEDIKTSSHGLRGTLVEGLADPVTGSLSFEDQRLVKFHGSYQQDDRDLRDERRRQKLEPAHQFMIRIRAPGGVFTREQWLKLDAIATTWANHSLRVTTRQTFQFHGVIKRELKATMQAINAAALDTVSACGDVNRNVLAASNPRLSRLHAEVYG